MKNKRKFGLWIDTDVYDAINKKYKDVNCKTRGEFIQKAIEFYLGYIQHENCVDFLTPILSGTIKGTVQGSEDRLSRLLFKTAVELAKLTEIMAAVNRLDDSTMRKLHIRCIDEVRKINGVIRLEDAVKFQHTSGDD